MLHDWGKRFLWLSVASLIGRSLPYIILIWLGRHTSMAVFASVGVVFAWTTVSASLTTAGLSNVAAQRLAPIKNLAEISALIRRILKIGVMLSGLLVVLVLMLGADRVVGLFGEAIDARVVWPALISGMMWSLVVLAVAILNGIHLVKQASIVLSLGGIMQGMGLLLGHWTGRGEINEILWGFVGGNASILAFVFWRLSSLPHLSVKKTAARQHVKNIPLGSAVAWATLGTASVTPVTFAAGAIISHGNDGTLQLAQFYALEQLHQLGIFLPSVMAVAMLPVLSRETSNSGADSVRAAVKFSWLLVGGGGALAFLLAWDPTWLHQLVGNPALSDFTALRIMLIHVAIFPSLSVLGSTLLARGQFITGTFCNMAWASILLGTTWVCRDEGAAAMQIARLTASVLLLLLASALLWNISSAAQSQSDLSRR